VWFVSTCFAEGLTLAVVERGSCISSSINLRSDSQQVPVLEGVVTNESEGRNDSLIDSCFWDEVVVPDVRMDLLPRDVERRTKSARGFDASRNVSKPAKRYQTALRRGSPR